MKVLIADDEPVARRVLRELLEDIAGVVIAGEAANGNEALERTRVLHPDVLLLDLQMPGMSGFQVADHFPSNRPPIVIFVTAYDKHALEAFDAGAVDYLLKPVRKERLEMALAKAQAQLAGLSRPGPQPAAPALRKIVGRMGNDLHLLDPSEVIAFHADGDVVHIVTANARYYSEHSLKTLEEKLPESQFRRVHRSTIINTNHIRRISPLSSKRWLLRMANGLEVVVSKRLAGVVREGAW